MILPSMILPSMILPSMILPSMILPTMILPSMILPSFPAKAELELIRNFRLRGNSSFVVLVKVNLINPVFNSRFGANDVPPNPRRLPARWLG
jgi:hypothetical protein